MKNVDQLGCRKTRINSRGTIGVKSKMKQPWNHCYRFIRNTGRSTARQCPGSIKLAFHESTALPSENFRRGWLTTAINPKFLHRIYIRCARSFAWRRTRKNGNLGNRQLLCLFLRLHLVARTSITSWNSCIEEFHARVFYTDCIGDRAIVRKCFDSLKVCKTVDSE